MEHVAIDLGGRESQVCVRDGAMGLSAFVTGGGLLVST